MSHLVISHPRSGLTWLRWLAHHASARIYPERYAKSALEKDNRLFAFTHDGMGLRRSTVWGHQKRVKLARNPWGRPQAIFLLRDPLDMLWSNWNILGIGTFSEFLRSKDHGIEPYISWLIWWHAHRSECEERHVFRYEDFLNDTAGTLHRFLTILGHELIDWWIDRIVAECSFSKMKAYEKEHGAVLPDVVGPAIRKGVIGESRKNILIDDYGWARERIVTLIGTFAECIV